MKAGGALHDSVARTQLTGTTPDMRPISAPIWRTGQRLVNRQDNLYRERMLSPNLVVRSTPLSARCLTGRTRQPLLYLQPLCLVVPLVLGEPGS